MTQDHKLTVRFKRLKELLLFSESCHSLEPGARGGRRWRHRQAGTHRSGPSPGTFYLLALRGALVHNGLTTVHAQNELRNVPRIYTCVRLREAARVS